MTKDAMSVLMWAVVGAVIGYRIGLRSYAAAIARDEAASDGNGRQKFWISARYAAIGAAVCAAGCAALLVS